MFLYEIFSPACTAASSTGLDKENDFTSSNEVDTEDDGVLNNHQISSSLSAAWVDEIRFSSYRSVF